MTTAPYAALVAEHGLSASHMLLIAAVPEGARVLDVGCATGYLAAADPSAGDLPAAPVAVRVAHEEHAPVVVAHDELHAVGVGPAHEPPDAQPRMGGPIADAPQADQQRWPHAARVASRS